MSVQKIGLFWEADPYLDENLWSAIMLTIFQANVLHVYRILRENDFPMEQVITMLYDDIAFNKKWVH